MIGRSSHCFRVHQADLSYAWSFLRHSGQVSATFHQDIRHDLWKYSVSLIPSSDLMHGWHAMRTHSASSSSETSSKHTRHFAFAGGCTSACMAAGCVFLFIWR